MAGINEKNKDAKNDNPDIAKRIYFRVDELSSPLWNLSVDDDHDRDDDDYDDHDDD